MKKIICLLITVSVILSVTVNIFAVSTVKTITGESSRTTEQINLTDGTKTGVDFTTVKFSGTYGTNKVLHCAECDLSNTHLSVEAFNCGTYLVSKTAVTTAASNLSKNGKTVLAALNGDLWMTTSNGNASKTLAVSRGSMIIDREIWATQEIKAEQNIDGLKNAFGVTSKNQPIVGVPEYKIAVSSSSVSFTADGLNRIPADNSIIIFNRRVYTTNYALTDSYEIELESTSPAFTLSNAVTAKVKAIYPSGSTTRPSIGANTVIITARGTRISEVEGFKVGDTVTFSTSVIDTVGNTDLWYDVVTSISGHMMPLYGGEVFYNLTDSKEYPASFIGISDSGKVMLSTVTCTSTSTYKGVRINQAASLLREMGYNSVFFLDGGGSATMVTLKEGTYTVRNNPSDGSPRSVINGVAVFWNTNPVCEKQGDLNYIERKAAFPTASPKYVDGSLMPFIDYYNNDVSVRNTQMTTEANIRTSKKTNDPYFILDYTKLSAIESSDLMSVILRVKPDERLSGTSNLGVFIACEGVSGYKYYSATVQNNGEWQNISVKLSGGGLSGRITAIRIDPYDGAADIPMNTDFGIAYIGLCESTTDSINIKNGTYPEGAITNYLEQYHDETSSHRIINVPAKAASCTEDGYSAYSYCDICGEYLTAKVVSHATGHDYQKGVCTKCLDKDPNYVEIIIGDLDGDRKITAIDVNIIKRIVAAKLTPTVAGDMNSDGKVTAADVNLLKKKIVSG